MDMSSYSIQFLLQLHVILKYPFKIKRNHICFKMYNKTQYEVFEIFFSLLLENVN